MEYKIVIIIVTFELDGINKTTTHAQTHTTHTHTHTYIHTYIHTHTSTPIE